MKNFVFFECDVSIRRYANIPRGAIMSCTVLVCVGDRRRPIELASPTVEALDEGVRRVFADVLPSEGCSLAFQVKDERWQGMFVDICREDSIPDRSVINVIMAAQTTMEVESLENS